MGQLDNASLSWLDIFCRIFELQLLDVELMIQPKSNGYAELLARRIFERLIAIQTAATIKRERPRLSSSGFLFNQRDIERVIKQHDKEMN